MRACVMVANEKLGSCKALCLVRQYETHLSDINKDSIIRLPCNTRRTVDSVKT